MNWKSALAELLIIVAGIIMALAVDRWTEERRDIAAARSYVERLQRDVEFDLGAYARTVAWAQAIDNSAVYVLDVYRGRNPPREEYDLFAYHIFRASWDALRRPTHATYDDLINTGNIGLLAVSVRDALTDYHSLQQDYVERRAESFANEARRGYWRVPEAVLGPDLVPAVWLRIQGNPPDFVPEPGSMGLNEADVERIVAALRARDDLEPSLAMIRHTMAQYRILFGERMPSAADRFSEALERQSTISAH